MRGCVLFHSKIPKDNSGVFTLMKKMIPYFEEHGVVFDIVALETNKPFTESANWMFERNCITIPKKNRPFPAMTFGMQQQAIAMYFENLDLTEALFERLKKVHYDFVFTIGSRGFHLLSLYGINKHLPIWCDLNLQTWEPECKREFEFLYGLENIWISAHFKLEQMVKERFGVKHFFPTTYPIDIGDEPIFSKTENKVCVIGNKRADKTPDINGLDEALQGRLSWLTGMPPETSPELQHGNAFSRLNGKDYTNAIEECRFGVSLSKFECLGIAILEQAVRQPVFLRKYKDKTEWLNIHEVCPTWETYGELRQLMSEYSTEEKWIEQVRKQRTYVEENFNSQLMRTFVSRFLEDIRPEPSPYTGDFTGTMSVNQILDEKGWKDGVGALNMFRKMKAQGIETVELSDSTYFTTEGKEKIDELLKLDNEEDVWSVF